jgi:FdhE protein
MLKCPYCHSTDHARFVNLRADGRDTPGSIEGCQSCHQYMKVFATLQGCAPESVYVEDLATVDFDLAALDAGFSRPAGLAAPVNVLLRVRASTRRFSWARP